MQSATEQLFSTLGQYSSDSRLCAPVVADGPDLSVEAFAAGDELQGPGPGTSLSEQQVDALPVAYEPDDQAI